MSKNTITAIFSEPAKALMYFIQMQNNANISPMLYSD